MPILNTYCCGAAYGWLGIICGLLELLLYMFLYSTKFLLTDSRLFSIIVLVSIGCMMISVFLVKAVLTNNRIYFIAWLLTSAFVVIVLHASVIFLIQKILLIIQFCMVLIVIDICVALNWSWAYLYYQQSRNSFVKCSPQDLELYM